MNTPLISVIVPVYNVEQYLPKCIDSILAQTYTNFELLLIDDGSPDNSGKICDEYAAKDSRIKVFHKENGGASSARNLGLDNAIGEWVCFVDSDDWIDSNMYEILIDHTLTNDCDILFWGYQKEFENGESNEIRYSDVIKYYDVSNKIAGVYELEKSSLFGWTWCKMFRREIIKSNQLYFNQSITIWEDHIFTLQFMEKASNMIILPIAPYHYRDVESSLIKNQNKFFDSEKKRSDEVYYNRIKLIESVGSNQCSEYMTYSNRLYLQQCFRNIKLLYIKSENKEIRLQELLKCKQKFYKNKKYIKKIDMLFIDYLILKLPNNIIDTILNSLFR